MMPGTARKLRLMVDWTVGLAFGRDSSELGQLGHPPSLRGYIDAPVVPETPANQPVPPPG
jgi:NADH dehydrogenase